MDRLSGVASRLTSRTKLCSASASARHVNGKVLTRVVVKFMRILHVEWCYGGGIGGGVVNKWTVQRDSALQRSVHWCDFVL
jgi:hypothetical protein